MMLRAILALVAFVASGPFIAAGEPAQSQAKAAPATASPSSPRLDPVAATQAYVAQLTPEQITKSDSYFEGGYWLILWNFLVSAGLSLALLTTGLSARMRNVAERVWPFAFGKSSLETIVYGAQYFLFTMILGFPLTIYQGYFREHDYGLSDQPLGDWLKDQAIGIAVGQCSAGSRSWSFMRFCGTCRNHGGSGPPWRLWRCCSCSFLWRPFISRRSLTNTRPSTIPKVRDPILSLARANQIPADQVYVFDESKQSKRVSANVSGALGTMRISLNDNLLNRCSLAINPRGDGPRNGPLRLQSRLQGN